MGIRVNIPEIQNEKLRTTTTNLRKSIQMGTCGKEIELFSQNAELTGAAYTKLKEYFKAVYPPIFSDIRAITVQLSNATAEMITQFQACVGSLEGLEADTDKLTIKEIQLTTENALLEAEIQSYEARKKYYLYAAAISPVFSLAAIAAVEYKIRRCQKEQNYNQIIINKIKKICKGIEMFNDKCANIYDDAKNSIKGVKYTLYRKKVSSLGTTRYTKQMSKYNKDGTKNTGICNFSAVEMLLNRRLNYDGVFIQEFDDEDMFRSLKCTDVKKVDGGYIYSGGTEKDNVNYTNSDGTSYQQRTIRNVDDKMKNEGISDYREYIANLLEGHPEGIVIRSTYARKSGGHAVLVTDYEIVDGKVQLYVQDPVNNKRMKLEESYYGKNCIKSDGGLNGIDWIKYLE